MYHTQLSMRRSAMTVLLYCCALGNVPMGSCLDDAGSTALACPGSKNHPYALRHGRDLQGKLSFEAVQQLATEELLEKYIDSRCGLGTVCACRSCVPYHARIRQTRQSEGCPPSWKAVWVCQCSSARPTTGQSWYAASVFATRYSDAVLL